MGKIPNSIVPNCYSISQQVYHGSISFTQGRNQLVETGSIKPSSASDYINNFRRLVNGEKLTRTLNAYSMDYFLKQIHLEYGSIKLKNALYALMEHIKYYENLRKVNLKTMRLIHGKYSIIFNTVIDEEEKEKIIKIVIELSKKEILELLENRKKKDPEVMIISNKIYKRDIASIALIKCLRDFKCQICNHRIPKKDGSFYIEAAHIKAKNLGGPETIDNILVLCPNHHKEFDYGELKIITHTKHYVEFKLNNQYYNIKF